MSKKGKKKVKQSTESKPKSIPKPAPAPAPAPAPLSSASGMGFNPLAPVGMLGSMMPNVNVGVNTGFDDYEMIKMIDKYDPNWALEERQKAFAYLEMGRDWINSDPTFRAQIGGDTIAHQKYAGQLIKSFMPFMETMKKLEKVKERNPDVLQRVQNYDDDILEEFYVERRAERYIPERPPR